MMEEMASFKRTFAARTFRSRIAATPRLGRGHSAETGRGDAAAGTWIFRGDGSVETGARPRYTDDPRVVYAKDGLLVVEPKPMTADAWAWLTGGKGPADVRSALEDGTTLEVEKCNGDGLCSHAGKWDEPLPPVVSAKLTTKHKFQFRYGTAEVRLRLPKGDWIWPAIWLLPADNAYGPWPFSGELDLLEARGNGKDFQVVGSDQSGYAGNDHLAATVHCADAGGSDSFSIGTVAAWIVRGRVAAAPRLPRG